VSSALTYYLALCAVLGVTSAIGLWRAIRLDRHDEDSTDAR